MLLNQSWLHISYLDPNKLDFLLLRNLISIKSILPLIIRQNVTQLDTSVGIKYSVRAGKTYIHHSLLDIPSFQFFNGGKYWAKDNLIVKKIHHGLIYFKNSLPVVKNKVKYPGDFASIKNYQLNSKVKKPFFIYKEYGTYKLSGYDFNNALANFIFQTYNQYQIAKLMKRIYPGRNFFNSYRQQYMPEFSYHDPFLLENGRMAWSTFIDNELPKMISSPEKLTCYIGEDLIIPGEIIAAFDF